MLTIEQGPTKEGFVTLHLAGHLNNDTAGQLDEKIASALKARTVESLILDFAGVQFISSAGVGALIKAIVTLSRRKGHLYLVSPTPQVTKVFDVIRLAGILDVFTNTVELDEYLTRIQKRMTENDPDFNKY